jgi:hypothetical protein
MNFMLHSFRIYPFKSIILSSLLLGNLCILAHASPTEGPADFLTLTPRQTYDHCLHTTLAILNEIDWQLMDFWLQGKKKDVETARRQVATMKASILSADARQRAEHTGDPTPEEIENIRRSYKSAVGLSWDVLGIE